MVRSTEVTAVLQKFVARINAHDPIGIMAVCMVDHVFIDSLGSRVSGRECLEQARDAVRLAKSLCEDVEFSPEDATRSDPDFLCESLQQQLGLLSDKCLRAPHLIWNADRSCLRACRVHSKDRRAP